MNKKPFTVASFAATVKEHLERFNLVPENVDYFNVGGTAASTYSITSPQMDFSSKLNYGGSEGIYLDIFLEINSTKIRAAVVKTLSTGMDDFQKLGDLFGSFVFMANVCISEHPEEFRRKEA